MTIWDAPCRYPQPGSLYPCCRPPRPPVPPCPPPLFPPCPQPCRPCPPPCPPQPDCPEPCDEEYTVKVMGSDNCGNLILCVKRPRYSWCNGDWVPSKRWR